MHTFRRISPHFCFCLLYDLERQKAPTVLRLNNWPKYKNKIRTDETKYLTEKVPQSAQCIDLHRYKPPYLHVGLTAVLHHSFTLLLICPLNRSQLQRSVVPEPARANTACITSGSLHLLLNKDLIFCEITSDSLLSICNCTKTVYFLLPESCLPV